MVAPLLFASLLVAAFLAGGIDAIVGGGGLVQIPALFSALPGARPATVLATGKLAGLLGTTSAAARYLRSVRLSWPLLLPIIGAALLASLGGAMTASHVAPAVFRPLVPIMLGLVLLYTLLRRDLGEVHAPRTLGTAARVAGVLLAAAIGFYDGFFGPGTGSFLMVLFIRLYGFDFVHAAASARVVNVATNATALGWFTWHDPPLWPVGLAMAAANAVGGLVGARAAISGGSRLIRPVFVGVVAALIAKTGWDVLAPALAH